MVRSVLYIYMLFFERMCSCSQTQNLAINLVHSYHIDNDTGIMSFGTLYTHNVYYLTSQQVVWDMI